MDGRLFLFSLLIVGGLAFARGTQDAGNINTALVGLCNQLFEILPTVSMLMVISAGVVYAAGQFLGSEARARASTWATAMLVGAIVGIVIMTLSPPVLGIVLGKDVNSACVIAGFVP